MPGKIRLKQIESGELSVFINQSASGITVSYTTGQIYEFYTGAQITVSRSITSGVEWQGFAYGAGFPTVPRAGILGIHVPSGQPKLFANIYQETVTGCHISFSAPVPSSGYQINLSANRL